MLKRLSTVLLSAGLFLGLTPLGASATPYVDHHRDDDHYQCWYHCGDGYGYGYRRYRPRYCWYHDRYGWYRARCRGYDGHDYYGDHDYGDHDYGDDYRDGAYWRHGDDSDSGRYDGHREHAGP